ncbi:MAG: DUF559 domain-containing protein [Pseudomonadota bacterium]
MTDIAPQTRTKARRLRAEMTPQERRLWGPLRDLNHRLGLNFRRQAPVGRYIADFVEFGLRLVIEVDGGQHGGPDDLTRDGWLREQQFVVLRFRNNEVNENLDGVMQMILDAVEAAPPPQPSPTRGEGGAPISAGARVARFSASPPPRGEGLGGTRPERTRE